MKEKVSYIVKTSNKDYGVILNGSIKFSGSFEGAKDFQKENFKITPNPDYFNSSAKLEDHKVTVEIPDIYDGPPLTTGIRKDDGEIVGYFFDSYEFRNNIGRKK